MRRDLNPQTLRLTAERATYCATHQYFFTGKTFTRQPHTAKAICQMEHTGIEPAASCLQNRRRPIATNTPYSPAAFLPAYLTYLLYTFSTPSSNLTVILSGYPDWSDVYGRCLILTIFPFFLCPASHCSHFFLSLYSVPQISHFQSVVSFIFFLLFSSRVFFSLHLQYARVFKNAKFFADYFLVSAFSQEPDKTKWTVEESNL